MMTSSSWLCSSAVVSAARGSLILDRYGWDSFFRDRFAPFAEQGLTAARVIAEVGPLFRVVDDRGERLADVSGRVRHSAQVKAEMPAVGDWVALRAGERGPRASIYAVLPRRSAFSRKAAGQTNEAQVVAANIDTVFLVMGLDLDFNVRRIERAVLLAHESGVEPVIVLSKADLCKDAAARVAQIAAVAPNLTVAKVSMVTGEGIDALESWLTPRKTVVLVGSSGVGKSTLVNWFLGEERQSTKTVREHDHRGKHTTTRRELMVLPSGALLIDTPGIRELGLLGGSGEAGESGERSERALREAFADVEGLALQCAFSNCTHVQEPRCAIKHAVETGTLEAVRFQSYLKLKEELATPSRRAPRSTSSSRASRSKRS